jgi:putative DNA primase/helicase
MTSSESAEDGALREDFIKRATGSDPLKARHMREDFFQFNPTHKLQQLTNHRPRIIGQDFAIWRRVMLIEYPIRFGTQAELSAGTVDALRDDTLSARLAKEREGIFAWIIAGTVEWLVSGLNPPAKVLAATKDYKAEQDTVGGFIVDECELGISNEAVFNAPAGSGIADSLYQRYTAWTEVNGIRPLSAKRFMGELQRLVPACRVSTTSRNSAVTPSKRHNVQIVHGIA